nr:A-kinase anchor protein 12-like [Anolis sagrei ordinatus]
MGDNMEGHAESQSSNEEEEETRNQEKPIDEMGKKASRLLTGTDEESTGPEQDMSEDLAEPNQEAVDDLGEDEEIEKEVALDVIEEEAEEMAELEKTEEQEKTGPSSEQDHDETNVSPDEREAEGDTGEEMEEELALVEEVPAGEEDELILEVDGKESRDLAGVEDGEEEEHADSEEGDQNEDVMLIGIEKEIQEIIGEEDLVMEKAKEVSGSERRDTEGESGEDVSESVENQEEVEKLSGLEQRENLEKTEEEQERAPAVDQEKAEEAPGTDERELPDVTVGGDAASAEVQREQEELVEFIQVETQVLTEEGVEESTIDQRQDQVLVEAGEETLEVEIGKEDLASGMDQTEIMSEADQSKTESKTAEEDIVSAANQREIEGLTRVSQGEMEQLTGNEGMSPADQLEAEAVLEKRAVDEVEEAGVSQGEVEEEIKKKDVDEVEVMETPGTEEKKAEDVDLAMEQDKAEETEDDAGVTVSQGGVEDLLRASQEKLDQVTIREDIIPEVGEKEDGTVPEEDTVIQRETEDLIGVSQGEVEQVTGNEDVTPAVDQVEAEAALEDLRKEKDIDRAEEVSVSQAEIDEIKKMVDEIEAVEVPGTDEKKAEDVDLAMDKGKTEEDVAIVVEREVTVAGDVVLAVAEEDSGTTDVATEKVDTVPAVAHTETQDTMEQKIILPESLEEAGEKAELPMQDEVPIKDLEGIPLQSDEEGTKDMESRETHEKVEELVAPEKRDSKDLEGFDQGEGKQLESLEETGKEQVALAKDLGEAEVYQDQRAEPGVAEKVLSKSQLDAVERKIPSQEEVLARRSTFPEDLIKSTQEIAGVVPGDITSRWDQTAEPSVAEKVLSKPQFDAVEIKIPSQEKVLARRSKFGEDLIRPTQEIAGVVSGEVTSRWDSKKAKLSQEEAALPAKVGWRTPDLSRQTLSVTEKSGRPVSSTVSMRSSQPTPGGSKEQRRMRKGKIITGLAGLRQGPIVSVHHGAMKPTGGRGGVLDHLAPGLIITSLTAQAEQRGLIKEDHKQLERGPSAQRRPSAQREIQSPDPERYWTRGKTGERVVLMGYRIGREGMSCFSKTDNRAVMFQEESDLEAAALQQGPGLEKAGKLSSHEQLEQVKEEQDVKEQEVREINVTDEIGQGLEGIDLTWLGRPLSGGYAASRPTSGWTAGLGSGHGLTLRSLRAEIKERIDMMVAGQGASKSAGQGVSKSAGQSPEPPKVGVGRRMIGLAGKPENVHWLKKVLGSDGTVDPLSVAGRSSDIKPQSPTLTSERRSPGLLTGRQQLKDWRDGVMGIAIKRYNAMRRAMWGEGPVGLHVRGVKIESIDSLPGSSIKTGSILEQVERKVRRLEQHVTAENVPALEVEGVSRIQREP